MSCPKCRHCQQLADRAVLVLTRRPQRGATAPDPLFYREFGNVYDLAVERFRQPMRAIRDVNPDVSAHQCHAWLRRARELGFVRTPAQERTPAPLPELPATAERVAADDLARRVLEDEQVKLWAWNDIPLTAERLESTLVGKRMTAEQRRHVLDVLAGAAPGHEAADG